MPVLVVDKLRCIQDTPEWTPDEVYLLVVSAATRGAWELRVFAVAPEREWRGLAAGAKDRVGDVVVDTAYRADHIYLAALIEQDGTRDFGLDALSRGLQPALNELYRAWASIRSVGRAELSAELTAVLEHALLQFRHDDDPVGVAAIPPFDADAPQVQLLFEGPRRRYRLWFKLNDRLA